MFQVPPATLLEAAERPFKYSSRQNAHVLMKPVP